MDLGDNLGCQALDLGQLKTRPYPPYILQPLNFWIILNVPFLELLENIDKIRVGLLLVNLKDWKLISRGN